LPQENTNDRIHSAGFAATKVSRSCHVRCPSLESIATLARCQDMTSAAFDPPLGSPMDIWIRPVLAIVPGPSSAPPTRVVILWCWQCEHETPVPLDGPIHAIAWCPTCQSDLEIAYYGAD
jgi:hypothetical protein